MAPDIRKHNLDDTYMLHMFKFHLLHRMKPTRIRMCHSLVMNYGLYKKMEIFVSSKYLDSLTAYLIRPILIFTESKAGHKTRNDAVSFRRICGFSESHYPKQHELVRKRTA